MRSVRGDEAAVLNGRRIAVVCSVALIAVATLTPLSGEGVVHGCLVCGETGLADAINNVILFLPLGAALGANRIGWRRALLISALYSGLVELAQALVIPGRDASPGDLIFNAAGGLLGYPVTGLPGWARRLPAGAARAGALGAAALAVAMSAAACWLLAPRPLQARWYGQWTARLGQYSWYRGRVLRADLGDLALPNRELAWSADVRRQLLAGDTLSVLALAGPSPPDLAPIFSIYDGDRREMFLLGADRDDLVARVRARSRMFRLDQADLRLRGALRDVAAGDTLDLAFARFGRHFCLSAVAVARCDLGLSPVRGWSLLLAPVLPAWMEAVLDAATAAALLVGVGLLSRGPSGAVLAFAITVVALGVVPWVLGAGAVPVPGWVGAALGFGLGSLLGTTRRGTS